MSEASVMGLVAFNLKHKSISSFLAAPSSRQAAQLAYQQ